MRHNRWRITGTLTTTSPLHIGSGDVVTFDHPSLKDKDGKLNDIQNDIQGVVKDWQRKPIIPGTALKGVLRAWAEQMLPAESSSIARIFGLRDVEATGAESGWAEFCTAFVVAPDPEHIKKLAEHVPYWYGDANDTRGPERALFTGILSHVSIDRCTGAAAHNMLYWEEFVPEGISFKVEINASRLNDEEISLLLAILETGSSHPTHPLQFGANGADGWGRMSWTPDLNHVHKCEKTTSATPQVGFDCCQQPVTIAPSSISTSPPEHISLALMLNMQGPFLVNDASRAKRDDMTDEEKKKHTNFTPLRRATGDVWLPASSLRGALRERAEFLLRSLNPQATGDPHKPSGDGPIERLFGKTSQAARLCIEEPKQIEQPQQIGERCNKPKQDFVAIDRFTGGAAEGAKFDATYADRPTFQTKLTLNVSQLQPEDVALLRLALEDLCQGKLTLGWGGAKGYGEATGKLSGGSIQGVDASWEMPESLCGDQLDKEGREWIWLHLAELSHTDRLKAKASAEQTTHSVIKLLNGQLAVSLTKKQLLEYSLSYSDEKGKSKSIKVNEDHVHQSLRGKVATGVTVEFEMDGGKQVRIRPQGEPWEEAASEDQHLPQEGEFAHPYYFLRMEDRQKFAGDLKDAQPIGHCRWEPGRYSGNLRVNLIVKTPLLICAPPPEDIDQKRDTHITYPVLKGTDDKPLLAASSIRGMLRSAYEAITNSRFGVFPFKPSDPKLAKRANARQPGYRMNAEDGLSLVPVRIENGKVYLMLGTTTALPTYDGNKKRWKVPGDLYAAWVPQYEKNVAGYSTRAITIAGNPPAHGQKAWCWLERMKHNKIPFKFWRVRQSGLHESDLDLVQPTPSNSTTNYTSCEEFMRREGYFCISNQNIKNKHDERFFFGHDITADIDQSTLDRYLDLIADCQDIHASELKSRREKQPPEEPTLYTPSVERNGKVEKAEIAAMSRHTYSPDDTKLDGRVTLCYAFAKKGSKGYVIEALYPVTISRKLYDRSPLDRLPKLLRPATSIAELSPADRVFGWVNQDQELAHGENVAAYRSHVQVRAVTCETLANDAIEEFDAKTLAILGQPKPQQGRFYLGDKEGKAQAPGRSKEEAGYKEGNRIRGPKVYPHHPNAENYQKADQWEDDNRQAILRKEEDDKKIVESNQNRSVTGWVKPGTEFAFDLHVTNLSAMELGGLVWLLSLPENHYLRLGLGKPLGFGSVRVESMAENNCIADGADLIKAITSGNEPTAIDLTQFSEQFENLVNQSNPELLSAFKIAASGLGKAPVHYPLTTAQSPGDGETFQWFVSNEKNETDRRLPLPDLISRSPFLKKLPPP